MCLLAGCGGGGSANSNGALSITPGIGTIDTNCTGCNATSSSGAAVEQFTAALSSGGAASVTWTVSGGDANSGPGTITSGGQYTPPSYLTADQASVTVTAALSGSSSNTATAVVTVTPGFLQPLTPENASLGASGTLSLSGYLAELGGTAGITYGLSSTASGSSGGLGTLGASTCTRGGTAFTYCTVTYTAPATISTGSTFIVATVSSSASRATSEVLLNTAGLSSNPASHQAELAVPIFMGSSGGNNNDYDTSGGQIVDCCGGTLGALVQNSSGGQFLLSANHVLARSDQAAAGEDIVQPALIDDNCMTYGPGAATTLVGTLSGWVPLSSSSSNVDAAIAAVNSNVDTGGNILELGLEQANGTLAAAPPGTSCTLTPSQVSCTPGKGETATLNMSVAKSGRTTGLTCANVSAVSLDVSVSYYKDCAETKPYLTKTYSGQIAIAANQFSDAGDSGSLVVDSSDAEPVGLFFAGGVDQAGVSEGVANPVGAVLSALGTQTQLPASTYTFVGTKDHAVSCLNYGNATATAAQARTLTDAETARAQQAMAQARLLVNPSAGILGVAAGKSSDSLGEGAVIVYVGANANVSVPATVNGVRTIVIPTTARAVESGSAPENAMESNAAPAMAASTLSQGIQVKQQIAQSLMRQNPAFFGVGVGQSLDNPKEAALVIYVDRRSVPAELPATIGGLRTRYVIMDRLHVTRSYATPLQSRSHCMAHPAPDATVLERFKGFGVRSFDLR